jgi:hypothetical protein
VGECRSSKTRRNSIPEMRCYIISRLANRRHRIYFFTRSIYAPGFRRSAALALSCRCKLCFCNIYSGLALGLSPCCTMPLLKPDGFNSPARARNRCFVYT